MRRRQLAGLILASASITLDGTATTIALPAIGLDLSSPVFRLQWISNAPLFVLAALLLPAGSIADRFGRVRVIRIGLATFSVGALAAMFAPSDSLLIGARFIQGAGGALILPAALAMLRGASADTGERARIFGVWAAWTGAASAVGPLLGGALVDLFSWRTVFVVSAAVGLTASLLVTSDAQAGARTRRQAVPFVPTLALVVLLGAGAYLLMGLTGGDVDGIELFLPAALALAALLALARDRRLDLILPRELLRARNCLAGNAATFSLYFGMFGLSFLVALYTQQSLGYSGLRAACTLLPVSVMLFFAEPFGRLGFRVGTRVLLVTGVVAAAGGICWIAAGPHPLAFWSRLVAGATLFGLGISVAVSALTHAAVAAVPESCAGAASGLNHAVVRAAGLAAIALLGSVAAPGASDVVSADGFRRAMVVCAVVVAAGGLAGGALVRDEEPGGLSEAA